MIFARLGTDEAEGAVLAHSLRLKSRALKKGHRLTPDDIAQLRAAGIMEVMAARLEDGDVGEDEAAARIAEAAHGPHTYLGKSFTGRRSIYAAVRGLAIVDRERVDRVNLVDESLTIATLAPFAVVDKDDMVATVKINPLSTPAAAVDAGVRLADGEVSLVRVAPLRDKRVGLLSTRLPGMKESVLDKTANTVRARVTRLGSHLGAELRCEHHESAVATAISELIAMRCSPIFVFGASAIVDRRDVVPQGIVKAGGSIDHFGMPVDPGNLTLLARVGDVAILGLPGSARSPRTHGCDLLIQRLLADIAITREDIMRMGTGGLLKEIPSRPQPRDRPIDTRRHPYRVAAVVLAAGQSRRMGRRNKLLAEIDGKAMVARVVDAALETHARPVIIVTGHESAAIQGALDGRSVHFVHNPDYAVGLSTSLAVGIRNLRDVDGALVCLGDMPRITPDHLAQLIEAFDPLTARSICVPTCRGKRGNPILWAALYFAEMVELAGDVGARHLLGQYSHQVHEVPMDDDAILVDVDTPDALIAIDTAMQSQST